jgi:hypothetical protein
MPTPTSMAMAWPWRSRFGSGVPEGSTGSCSPVTGSVAETNTSTVPNSFGSPPSANPTGAARLACVGGGVIGADVDRSNCPPPPPSAGSRSKVGVGGSERAAAGLIARSPGAFDRFLAWLNPRFCTLADLVAPSDDDSFAVPNDMTLSIEDTLSEPPTAESRLGVRVKPSPHEPAVVAPNTWVRRFTWSLD